MPRLRRPPELSFLSMRAVARISCQTLVTMGHQRDDNDITLALVQLRDYVAEVPAHLADELLRHVIVLMDAMTQVVPHYVGALLHPRCQTLDLSEPELAACKPQVKFSVLQNISVMPRLRYLDVKFCSPTGRDHEDTSILATRRVASHLPRLHQLVSLDVSWICTANMLRLIAENCPKLQRLVAQDSKLESGDARVLATLTQLRWLNVDSHHEPVTPSDITFLLHRLPSLAVLEYPDVEGVIATLKGSTPVSSFDVRDFSSALYRVNHQLLDDMNTFFPKLETLRLYKPAGDLSVLKKFRCLRVLSVNDCCPEILTSYLRHPALLQEMTLHSVSPISSLLTPGSTLGVSKLRTIRLMGCTGVDLIALNQLCPYLEELKLSQCSVSDLSSTPANAFLRLETLKVCGALKASHLSLLLSTCHHVTRVTVGASSTEDKVRHVLTDALWLHIMDRNPMSRLEKLHLVSDRVSRRILDEMLARLPSLSVLYLTGHVWSHELAGDAIDRLKSYLRPFEMRLRIQGAGLYYFSYPEDS